LAAIAVSTRDYSTAIPLLRQLSAEAPGDRLAPVELGRALALTGQEVEASALLAPALAAGYPDEKGALHALLARCLRRTGRIAEAEAAEARARQLSDEFQRRSAAPATAPTDAPPTGKPQ
jgi:predicted Zn-dependent protease